MNNNRLRWVPSDGDRCHSLSRDLEFLLGTQTEGVE
jgi:hypothetical protein